MKSDSVLLRLALSMAAFLSVAVLVLLAAVLIGLLLFGLDILT